VATVTSKGQITLPKKVRDALGLQPGSHVEFELQPGGVLLRKHIPDEVFDRWEGYLCGKTEFETADALIDALRGP
jgi:AbrB family looped-hinge helix DNA binding protein